MTTRTTTPAIRSVIKRNPQGRVTITVAVSSAGPVQHLSATVAALRKLVEEPQHATFVLIDGGLRDDPILLRIQDRTA